MASSSSLSSDVDVSSKKHKRKVVSTEKKLKIRCRHKIGVVYISLSKPSVNRLSIQSEDPLTECMLEIQHALGAKRNFIRRSKYENLEK